MKQLTADSPKTTEQAENCKKTGNELAETWKGSAERQQQRAT